MSTTRVSLEGSDWNGILLFYRASALVALLEKRRRDDKAAIRCVEALLGCLNGGASADNAVEEVAVLRGLVQAWRDRLSVEECDGCGGGEPYDGCPVHAHMAPPKPKARS